MTENNSDWRIYKGHGNIDSTIIEKLPPPPPWREFSETKDEDKGKRFKPNSNADIDLVNAALYLRRPLLVTGKPGTGKTSLAYAVAYELDLGKVLRWSITTKTSLKEGLYQYDAIARLQDASLQKDPHSPPDISKYLKLGPLGTAFAAKNKLRVLLIDEIDKSDIDLPNDLLHIFEEFEFEIPELSRLPDESRYNTINIQPYDNSEKIKIHRGKVQCTNFPLIIMTSNGERDFPPAFLRRCLRMNLDIPDIEQLAQIVKLNFESANIDEGKIENIIKRFVEKRNTNELSTDQLLNAIYLSINDINMDKKDLAEALWKSLSDY